jgi:hypothetical protein
MRFMIPAILIVLSQGAQSAPASQSDEWCFDRGQNAQLCEPTELACNKLRDLNSEIAHGPCRPVDHPVVGLPPTEPPAPPNPQTQTPTQR